MGNQPSNAAVERAFIYDPQESRTAYLSWHVTISEGDSDLVATLKKCLVYCQDPYQDQDSNVLYVEASIDQLRVVFNLCNEVIYATRAVPGKEPIKRSVAKPSEYYTLVVLKKDTERVIEDLKKYQSVDKVDWSGPRDYMSVEQDKNTFFVKAEPQIIAKLNAAHYTVLLYGDSLIRGV
jgi:hypothetical protein